MAVGRVWLPLLTRQPTGSSGGHPRRRRGGCTPTLPSFLYESAFQLAAFVVIWWWLRHRSLPPGEIFVWYVGAYGVFRFLVEFVRGNEVVWHGLTRPQLFLAVTIPLVLLRIALQVAQWRLLAPHDPARWCQPDDDDPHDRRARIGHAAAGLPDPSLRQRVLPALP